MNKNYLIGILLFVSLISLSTVSAQDRYWVGGTGSWSQTTHWSNVSGGSNGFSVPNSSTNVYIDNNSATVGYTISLDSSPVILLFNLSGLDNNLKRVFVKSNTLGTQRTISASNVVVSNVDFQDVAFNQTTDLSSGSPIGDCGGNSNITFTPATNLYWHNVTGSWSDSTKWFLGTGGSGGAGRVPLCQDTAIFDNASFDSASQTVTQDMPRIGSMNWTGVTNNPTFTTSTAASVFGSLILSPNMILTASTQTYTFEGRENYYLDSGNLSWNKILQIYTNLTLLSNFNSNTAPTLFSGMLDANDFNFTAPTFSFGQLASSIVYMGNGIWEFTQSGAVGGCGSSSYTLYSENSTIKITNLGTTSMYGCGKVYNNIWLSGNSGTFTLGNNPNTFNNFRVDNNRTVKFTAGTTQNIASWNASGNASSYVTIASTSGTNAILNFIGSGMVGSDYLNISDMTVNPALTWYAGSHSINSSDTNWIMADAPIQCGTLSTANSVTTLTANISSVGTCFTVTANNVTIDCGGYTITGDNSSNSYGVYSTKVNTNIRNCNIKTYNVGIYFFGATYGTILNTNITVTRSNAFGIKFANAAKFSNVTNVIVSTTGVSESAAALDFYTQSQSNRIENSSLSGGIYAVNFCSNCNSNIFIHNDFKSNSGSARLVYADSGQTFYMNNFTTTSGVYFEDTSGTSILNSTYDGVNQGNAWANVLTGAIIIKGNINSSISGLYVGSAGSGYPYNHTTSGGKFVCNFAGCQDNAPLTSTLLTPVIVNPFITPTTAYINNTLVCSGNASGGASSSYTYYYQWFVNNVSNVTTQNVSSGLVKNQNWNCQVIAYDTSINSTAVNTSTITILNSNTSMSSISNVNILDTQNLSVQVNCSDLDGETIYYYDNTSLFDINSSGYIFDDPSASDVGIYNISITCGDNQMNTSRTFLYNVTLSNTAPTTSPWINYTALTKNSVLSCVGNGTDADNNSLTYYYKWFRNNVVNVTTQNLTIDSKSQNYTCQVTPYDGTVNGTAVNTSIVTSINSVPSQPTPTFNTGTYKGDTFTASCSASTDVDTDAITYYYQFEVNTTGATLQAYSTNASYTVCSSVAGCNKSTDIRMKCKAYDGAEYSTETSYLSRDILNTAATTPTTPSITSGTYRGDTFVSSAGTGSTDVDSDSLTYTYQFTSSSTGTILQAFGASTSYTACSSNAACNKTGDIKVQVRVSDGSTNTDSALSSARDILNTAPTTPTTPSIATPAGTAYKGDTFTSSTGTGSTDVDPEDTVTYTYQFVSGDGTTILQAYGANSYAGCSADVGCNKTNGIKSRTNASDGTTTTVSTLSSTKTISNTAPVVPSADTLTPTTPVIGNQFTMGCSGSTDVDPEDSLTYFYGLYDTTEAVYRQAFSTTATYTLTAPSDSHDSFRTDCYANDASAVSTTRTGNTSRTVANTAPTVPSTLNLNASILVGQSLVAVASGSTDADSDALTYYYEFYNINDSSTVQAYSTTASYTIASTDVHNIIRVRSKSYDGTVYSTEKESNITVGNTAPIFVNSLSNINVSHSQNLSVQFNCTDVDADTILYYDNTSLFNINSSGYVFDDPLQSDVGIYNISITCGDGIVNVTSSFIYQITNAPPIYAQSNFVLVINHNSNIGLQVNVTDADSDTITYGLNDSRFTINQSGYINKTNLISDTGVYNVTVSAFDGAINSTMWILFNITNVAPSTAPYIAPAVVYSNESFSCYANASDSDNDFVQKYYQLYKDGVVFGAPTFSNASYITVSGLQVFTNWTCQVTPYDGLVNGTAVNSSQLTISNTAPTFNESNFVSTISHGQNISLQINASDIDGQTLTYAINDTAFTISSSTGLINKTNSLSTVGVYNVSVNVTDGTATSIMWVFFNITNTAPSGVLSLNLSNVTYSNHNVSINITGVTDSDSDPIYYLWYVNSSLVQNSSSNIYLTNFSVDGNYSVFVNSSDTLVYGSSSFVYYIIFDTVNPLLNVSTASNTVQSSRNISVNVTVTDLNPYNTTVEVINSSNSIVNSTVNTSLMNNSIITLSVLIDGVYSVNITALDAAGNINVSSILNITVDTTPPNVSGVAIYPAVAYYTTDLLCGGSYADNLLPESNSTFKWFKSTLATPSFTLISGQVNATIHGSINLFESTDILVCEYTPSDGYNVGVVTNSSNITIINPPIEPILGSGGGGGGSSFVPQSMIPKCQNSNYSWNGSVCVSNVLNNTNYWRIDSDLSNTNVHLSTDSTKTFLLSYYVNSVLVDPKIFTGRIISSGVERVIYLEKVSTGVYRFKYDFIGFTPGKLDIVVVFDGHPKTITLTLDKDAVIVAKAKDFFTGSVVYVTDPNKDATLIIISVIVCIILFISLIYYFTKKTKRTNVKPIQRS